MVSCFRWFRNNKNPARPRISLAKRSHQIGWQSIKSATPGALGNVGIGDEIHLSLQSYNWKLHLQQDHRCLWGKVHSVVLGICIHFYIHCLRVNAAGLIQFLILQKTFEEDCRHLQQLSSNSGVPTHPLNHFLGTSFLQLFSLSCGERGAQLRAEFGKTFWIL